MNFSRRRYIARISKRNGIRIHPAGFLLLLGSLILLPSQSTSLRSKAKPETLIKFATLAPEGSTWMKTMRALDKELRNATENRIGFKFYTGGVQGDEKDVLRKVRNGQLHGGGFTGFGLGSVVSAVRVLELPFLFEELEEVDFVRSRTDSLFSALFSSRGFVFLGWADVGFVYIFSNSPIRSPADLQQVRMWVWSGDPLAELFFKAFRISPIPLSAPDVLTSLQTGIVDAIYGSPLACVALQWFTRVKYMSDVPITHGLGAVLVSENALREADEADIRILHDLTQRYLHALNEKTRSQNIEAIELMKKEGLEVVAVDEEQRRAFFSTGKDAWQDGVDKIYPRALLSQITLILREYRTGAQQ